jgi:hypothetical protein
MVGMIEVKGSESCVALAVAEIQTFLLENATEKEKISSIQVIRYLYTCT